MQQTIQGSVEGRRTDRSLLDAGSWTQDAEAGYMLLAVVAMVALVTLSLAVAAPMVARQIRRDKELESEHRMQQYVRAIRVYYRKTGAYPASLDALRNTGNVRFLRKDYVDPLTGQANWRLLHLGEQKTTIKVFFGQEVGGIASSGLGSAAGLSSSGSSSTSTVGATSALASGFSGASLTTGSSGSTGSTLTSSSGGSVGGVIVGVGTSRSGASMLTPNGQKDYSRWEFWYDPRIEQYYQKGRQNLGIGTASASGSTSASSMGATSGVTSGLGSLSGAVSSGSSGTSGATGSTGVSGSAGATGATGSTSPTPP